MGMAKAHLVVDAYRVGLSRNAAELGSTTITSLSQK